MRLEPGQMDADTQIVVLPTGVCRRLREYKEENADWESNLIGLANVVAAINAEMDAGEADAIARLDLDGAMLILRSSGG